MTPTLTPTLDALVRQFREAMAQARRSGGISLAGAKAWRQVTSPANMATLLDALTAAQRQLDENYDESVKVIRRLEDRVLELESPWQPIETAPRDGTRIICWGPRLSVAECEWNAIWIPHGWYRSNQSPLVTPTHWMPMPSPPMASFVAQESPLDAWARMVDTRLLPED